MPYPRTPRKTRGSGSVLTSLARTEPAIKLSGAQFGTVLEVTAAPNKDTSDPSATAAVQITGAAGIQGGSAGTALKLIGGAPNGAGAVGTGIALDATGGGPGHAILAASTSGICINASSTTGITIFASSTASRVLQIQGDTTSPALPALSVIPQDAQPTGACVVGDMYVSTNGELKVCTVAGTPGTWRTVGWVSNDTALTTGGTTITVNWSTGRFQMIDLEGASGNVTLTLSNPVVGTKYEIQVTQGSVARNLIWPAAVKWPAGTAPTISVANDAVDRIELLWNGTIYMANFSQAYA